MKPIDYISLILFIIIPSVLISQNTLYISHRLLENSGRAGDDIFYKEKIITLENQGTDSLMITYTLTTGLGHYILDWVIPDILLPYASENFTVIFRPTAPGTATQYLILEHQYSSSPDTITLIGTSIGELNIGNSYDFGNVLIGDTVGWNILVRGPQYYPISISEIISNNPLFYAQPTSFTISIGDYYNNFYIYFTPNEKRMYEGDSITIVSTASNNPTSVSLSGKGVSSYFTFEQDTINLGSVPLEQFSFRTLRIRHIGNEVIYPNPEVFPGYLNGSMEILGDDNVFSLDFYEPPDTALTHLSPSLYFGQEDIYEISFYPSEPILYTRYVLLSHEGALKVDTLVLLGRGLGPSISTSEEILNFGDITKDTYKQESFYLKNPGSSKLYSKDTEIWTDDTSTFKILPYEFEIAPGDSNLIQVVFYPSEKKEYSNTLSINNNFTTNPIYVALSGNGLINQSQNTKLFGYFDTPGFGNNISFSTDFGFVADRNGGLRIYDFLDNTFPQEVSYVSTNSNARSVIVKDDYAYVATGSSGLRIVDISDIYNPLKRGLFNTPGESIGLDIKDNYVYVADGESGLRFINISDPQGPVEIGFYDTPGFATGVFVEGNVAFVADGDSGIRIINISNLFNPFEISHFQTSGSAQNLEVVDEYIYVADRNGGLRILDISDIENPIESGFLNTPGSALDIVVDGNFAYVADQDSGLRIINISNSENPYEVGFYVTPGEALGVNIHNGKIYIADGEAGVFVIALESSVGIENVNSLLPEKNILYQNYPNPFNSRTKISYQLPNSSYVTLNIYNTKGQRVTSLVNKTQSAGYYDVKWDASSFSSGIYFYRIETNTGFVETKKLILLK